VSQQQQLLTPADDILQQAVIHARNDNDFSFVAACFGPEFGGKRDVNWSLAPLQEEADAQKPENAEFVTRLGRVLHALGVTNAYGPSPVQFNAAYVPQKLLKQRIPLAGYAYLFRNKNEPADVSLLRRYEAGLFSGAGCMSIAATNGREFAYAHGGRDCLIDRARFDGSGRAQRISESVGNTIANVLGKFPSNMQSVKVEMHFAIPPRHYPHSLREGTHASFNQAVYSRWGSACGEVEYGILYLDLPRLARAQFEAIGIPAENIRTDRAYLPENFWLNGAKGFPRNLNVIVRKK
jgi:hypothetical protein